MTDNTSEKCPLCGSEGRLFYKNSFFDCWKCRGIFRSALSRPSMDAEKARYEKHHGGIDDVGYRSFVLPLTEAVISENTYDSRGLDFGAGRIPVLSMILEEKKYAVEIYDPFFHKSPDLLKRTYDYIVCCEVIEHFHCPAAEFELLRKMLRRGGTLYCMTHIYDDGIDFDKWYYKNDITHVFIYRKETLDWIKSIFGFMSLKIDDRLIRIS